VYEGATQRVPILEQVLAQGAEESFHRALAPHRQLHLIRVIGTDASG
jgi:hypothetical protein